MATPSWMAGTECGISPYRTTEEVRVGDGIFTAGGSRYEVLAVRPIANDPHRLSIRCRRQAADWQPGGRWHDLVWDSRKPRRKRTATQKLSSTR